MSTATDIAVAAPGSIFRFTVSSADEAVATIREKLGEHAKVISVRQIAKGGLSGLLSGPKLEVIAQVSAPPAPVTETKPAAPRETTTTTENVSTTSRLHAVSDAPASPVASVTDAPVAVAPAAISPDSRRAAPRLPDLLRRGGLSEQMIARLQSQPNWASLNDRPLHQALAEIGRDLRRGHDERPAVPLPARAAFIGSPGSGRTTALCKWLATEVFRRARTGLVVKAEFDRPNPGESLVVFCEALGVPVANFPATLPATTSGNQFLYADLPGLSLRHPDDNRAMAKFLEQEKIDGRILVLNAAYDHATLRQSYLAGRELGATHVVFTHLDELGHWGKLWDYLFDGALTPLFLSTGPSLTGDCEEDTLAAILRKTLPGG